MTSVPDHVLASPILGALLGDTVGSVHEGRGTKSTTFPLWTGYSRPTDDSVLTCATAEALLSGAPYARVYRDWARRYPHAGYGAAFRDWFLAPDAGPYGSWGNGSAMRASPIGVALDTVEGVLAEAERSAIVTHEHPDGIKGAQAAALVVFLARRGTAKEEIRREISSRFGYDLSRTVKEIRRTYDFDVSCQGSVPEAVIAFLESSDTEDAIRLAISLGGDADTQATIAGAAAAALEGGVGRTRGRAVAASAGGHARRGGGVRVSLSRAVTRPSRGTILRMRSMASSRRLRFSLT
jgi:ADP-ribosylglycohydrolase